MKKCKSLLLNESLRKSFPITDQLQALDTLIPDCIICSLSRQKCVLQEGLHLDISFYSSEKKGGQMKKRFSYCKMPDRFSSKPHGYIHLPFEDIKTLCSRSSVMKAVLEQALKRSAGR